MSDVTPYYYQIKGRTLGHEERIEVSLVLFLPICL